MIETERLTLRPYVSTDWTSLRAHCAHPAVMTYLLPVPDDATFDAMVERMRGFTRDFGYTFWTVVRRSDDVVLGVCGLKPGASATPIEGRLEIGWRLGRDHWGKGYAREAAQASLDWAWAHTDVAEVVAITVQANTASWGLMERIGMTRVAGGDFAHPAVADDSPLKTHILYRIERPAHD